MIAYTNRRLIDIYNSVMLKIGEHRTAINIDKSTMVMFINRAIRETLAKSLPYKDWAYVLNMNVANGTILGTNYLKFRRVIVSSDGNPPYIEARYSDPKEYFTLDNWQRKQIWNQSTGINPIFTIWGGIDGVGIIPQRLRIYLSPNTQWQTGTAPTGYRYNTYNVSGIMEYYAVPTFLVADGDIVPIPYEFEELVILYVLARVYAKTSDIEELKSIHQKIEIEQKQLIDAYAEKRRTEKRELEEYTEPVIPLVTLKEQPGELKSV